MRGVSLFALVLLTWILLFINGSYQLQPMQYQILLQVRKHLEYPLALANWETYSGDLCYVASTSQMTIKCQNDSISDLRVMGDKLANVSNDFNGFAVPNKTLSDRFSMDSLVTTLTRLTSLKALSLVSLGIWGQIPDKIHRLVSLEMLDLSSNFIYGPVPQQMSRLVKLQTLKMDDNFFNGTVPNWLNSLSNLTILKLKNNQLKGRIPLSVGKIATLTDLTISHNELSGKVPNLSTLTSLHILDLRENHLDSELPAMPTSLVTALLSNNSFSGKIYAQFDKLDQLQHLDLSNNHLSGTPPPVVFSLPKISFLDLSSNMFDGSLSSDLSCGSELGFVDISDNKFVDELPSCLEATSNDIIVKVDGNCLSVDKKDQHEESFCKKSGVKTSSGDSIGVLVGLVGGAFFVFLLFVVVVAVLCKKYRSRGTSERHIVTKVVQDNAPTGVSAELLTNARFISKGVKFGAQGITAYRVFTLEELKEATNDFDQSALMGEGSNGKIYKGILENGTYVAIRSITFHKKHSIQNLKGQLDLLSKLHHPHLVGLFGHCIDVSMPDDSYAKKMFLVYEYVPNGNYHTHLSENRLEKVLKWSDRLAILIGVAKAVDFLHTGVIPGCFKNCLKTKNILLDEHHLAKLSDYGLSILKEEPEKRELKGERTKSGLNQDDDVYNFGFILLESLVGPIVTGKGEAFLLNEMTSFGSQDGRKRIVDPTVLTTSSQESLSIVVSITKKCISLESSNRPSFEEVLWNLQYAAQVQATTDAEQRSDSTSQT